MAQQLIALVIIMYFLSRVFWQKKSNKISKNEFIFWNIFWLSAFLAVVFLKKIDEIVSYLGFSSTGIDVLFYLSVLVLFFLILKITLKIEKIEKNITKIIRENSLRNK